jgi:hypothetical protein
MCWNFYSLGKNSLLRLIVGSDFRSLAVGASKWDAKASGTLRKYPNSSKVCYNNVIK